MCCMFVGLDGTRFASANVVPEISDTYDDDVRLPTTRAPRFSGNTTSGARNIDASIEND